MPRKPLPEEHIHLGSQKKPERKVEAHFESLKSKLAKRLKLAESQGAILSSRHLDAFPIDHDGKTPKFVDDWKRGQ